MLCRLHCAAAGGLRIGLCSAAATAVGGAAARDAQSGRFATSSPSPIEEGTACLYAVLGVAAGATQQELKAAFRQRAKELHPDAAPGAAANGPAFVQLLAAYKVLSKPRSRQLYDLSRDVAGPRVLRAAAASGVNGAADAAYEEVPVDLSWGLGRMLRGPPPPGGALDHLRQELQGELHAAVRRAYLGPKLDCQELASGWLPDAFEADERATADCPDLLHLVSGRQVLGAVRERRAELLARAGQGPAAALGDERASEALLEALLEAVAAQTGALHQQGVQQQRDGEQRQRQQGAECGEEALGAADGSLQQQQQQRGQRQSLDTQHAQQAEQQGHAERAQQAQQAQRDPDVLDLYVGDRLVATAVRHFPDRSNSSCSDDGAVNAQAEVPGSCQQQRPRPVCAEDDAPEHQRRGSRQEGHCQAQHDHSARQVERDQQHAQQAEQQQVAAEVISVYSSPSAQLLARVEAQQLDPGSATASSARLLDVAGRHTHTVYRTQTPLVRHLTFAAEPSTLGLSRRRPSRLVVCRTRRAWLPPSSLWLFRPLSHHHDVGGWYLEWAGQEQGDHPAALHPAVFVLTAAFDSLDHERAARQPLGLFGRLRGGAAGGPRRREAEGSWRGWLSSALRFHGAGKQS